MILIIIDFIENNWEAFTEHCKSHGMANVDEIEDELEKLRRRG